MLDTKARKIIQPAFEKTADFFLRRNLTPNHVTVMALIIGLIPAVLLYFQVPGIWAVAVLWLSGFLDAVDGTMARKGRAASLFGTVMDITFDRLVEISLLIMIAYRLSSEPLVFVILASTIILNMTVFLTVGAATEKASEKTFYYPPGLTERTEGFLMFSLMILLTGYTDIIALIFGAMVLFTAGQRFMEGRRFLQ